MNQAPPQLFINQTEHKLDQELVFALLNNLAWKN
jgi:hypothetical protein